MTHKGAATHEASEWRIAEIQGSGVAGWSSGTPRKYEINAVFDSGVIAPSATWSIPLGIAEVGRSYRARVSHRDSTNRWSYWSESVEFSATPPPISSLVHYWNFNDATPVTDLLVPSQTSGGASINVMGTCKSGTGQSFAAASVHFRLNNPLTAGTRILFSIPTTCFSDIIVKCETRRSAQGAGSQIIEYTTDGMNYLPFVTQVIAVAAPEVRNLDFRGISAASNNPLFGLRMTFAQAAGGISGNNRFDNFTVEGFAIPVIPSFSRWQNLHFTDLSKPLISGPLANPSGDGILNLTRYAHGVGFNEAAQHLLLTTKKSENEQIFRYDASLPDVV